MVAADESGRPLDRRSLGLRRPKRESSDERDPDEDLDPRDGKKRLVDSDGRVFRVYDKKSGALTMQESLYARRLTDETRRQVFGPERIILNPTLWASILHHKSSVDLFQFNYGSRVGWATAALYHSCW